jgi:hypothetical protein
MLYEEHFPSPKSELFPIKLRLYYFFFIIIELFGSLFTDFEVNHGRICLKYQNHRGDL